MEYTEEMKYANVCHDPSLNEDTSHSVFLKEQVFAALAFTT
jgi:hypothetical protein